jgi:hypothetical protein
VANHRALLIANAMYDSDPHNLPALMGPRNDARILRDALCDVDVGLFKYEHVEILNEATGTAAKEKIDLFFDDADKDDTLLLYYSGRGKRYTIDGELYFCTSDTRTNRLPSTAIEASWVRRQINNSRARTTIILLDCCHSGAFKGSDIVEALSGGGSYVLSSTSADSLAKDSTDFGGASPFTGAVVEGLRRGADDSDGDGRVSVEDLYRYVRDHLSTKDGQIPHRLFHGEGYPIIARRDPNAKFRTTSLPTASPPVDVGGRRAGAHVPVHSVTIREHGNRPVRPRPTLREPPVSYRKTDAPTKPFMAVTGDVEEWGDLGEWTGAGERVPPVSLWPEAGPTQPAKPPRKRRATEIAGIIFGVIVGIIWITGIVVLIEKQVAAGGAHSDTPYGFFALLLGIVGVGILWAVNDVLNGGSKHR